MNEDVILLVNYDKICRLCLQSTGAMSDLFEDNDGIPLKELVFRAISLEVQTDDGLPNKICHRCRHIVELSCELKSLALKSNTLLLDASNCALGLEEEQEDTKFQSPALQNTIENENPTLEETSIETQEEPLCNNKIIKTRTKEEFSKDHIAKKNIPHIRIKSTPPKHLTCQICLSAFSSTDEVTDHVQTHYLDTALTSYLEMQRPFECEVCADGKIITKTQLIAHHRRHLGVDPFVCKHPGCDFVGKSKNSLRHHLIKHSARSVVCDICGASYRRRSELSVHVARAHRPAAATCRACPTPARFRNAITYRAHLLRHHTPPRHACQWVGCGKAYHSPHALATHARSHAGARLYRCHLCNAAAYTSHSMLNRHIRMHERGRPSQCDVCAAWFEEYGAFYRHRVTQHGPWLPHRCPACNKRYQKESKLQTHMETCEMLAKQQNKAITNTAQNDETGETPLTQEIIEDGKTPLGTNELLDKQPGIVHELGKDYVLQELPADGLLYIEVDEETIEGESDWNE